MNDKQATLFWAKVEKTDTCWTWTAHRDHFGYGRIQQDGRARVAHRVSWEAAYGPIPEGLCVLHRCDNPPCIRPEHLFLGTKVDNCADKVSKGRQARGEYLRAAQAATKATGDRNGTRTHPEARKRGDAHWTRQDPAKVKRLARRGTAHPLAKLSEAQVREIRAMRAAGDKLTVIAQRFGISFQNVSAIANRRLWPDVSAV